MKKLLPTSTAGSLPKPAWLAQPETLWSPWKLQDEELVEGKQDALRLALQEQQHAGIDIVSDGGCWLGVVCGVERNFGNGCRIVGGAGCGNALDKQVRGRGAGIGSVYFGVDGIEVAVCDACDAC